MIKEPILKCPKCGTDDFLYAQPSKHFTYIECVKEDGGCGFQYTLPNEDGSNKFKDNLIQQQLDTPLDHLLAGYFGMQEEGESFYWVLIGIVSELKKDELEKHLKEKVDLFSKLPKVKEAKYMIKEYTSTGGATSTFISEPVTKPNAGPAPEVDSKTGEIKDIMALRHKVQSQSQEVITEKLLSDHGQVVGITCASCGSKHLTYGGQDKAEIDILSSEMLKIFDEAKKSKEQFEWGIINCYGCEGQCDLLEIEFTDGAKINVSWEDYPKLYGVTNMKNYMDDFFGALAKAQKNGTRIIGV